MDSQSVAAGLPPQSHCGAGRSAQAGPRVPGQDGGGTGLSSRKDPRGWRGQLEATRPMATGRHSGGRGQITCTGDVRD